MSSPVERARRYIAKCPVAVSGQHGHRATFCVAARLVNGFALSELDALMLLREWNNACVPPWSEADLVHKIKSAANVTHPEPRGYLLRTNHGGSPRFRSVVNAGNVMAPPKPEFRPDILKWVAAKTSDIQDVVRLISERSPVPVEAQDSGSVLRRLYLRGSGERVILFNVMESQGQFVWEADKSDVTQNSDLPSGEDGVWFLPQPVDGKSHPNPRLGGRWSRRSEESVTAWRYAVLESDQAEADDWLRCLVQVPLRIASICESGRRSIHALVRVDAMSKPAWDSSIGDIKPLLINLGADRSALTAVRLSRLPQAKRGERVQRLLYLNPEPSGLPILNQPTREARYGRRWRLEGVSHA